MNREFPTDEEWIASGDAARNSYGCWLEWLNYKREQFVKEQNAPAGQTKSE